MKIKGLVGCTCMAQGIWDGTRVFFCCLVFVVVGSLEDEPGRPVSE